IEELQRQLSVERTRADEEKQKLAETYKTQMSSLEEKCAQKTQQMQIIQAEFRMMKEFRRRKADLEKELDEIEELQRQLSVERTRADEEKQKLAETYKTQMSSLEEKCAQKTQQMQIIQAEFRMMKEFRRRKADLEKELDEMKESLRIGSREHKESLAAMERRFFQDKQRLEKEAEKKIVMLAEKAHNEAIVQLDDAGRSIFKENVRLKEAISYHVREAYSLQKAITQLKEEKERLLQEKETNEKLVQEKVLEVFHKNAQIQELQRTVRTMEHAEQRRLEIEDGMQKNQLQIQGVDQTGSAELQKLHKLLEMKDREMSRVKKLAHNILQERTEVERFLLEALQQVKQEIKSSRMCYQKMAQAAYNSRMMQAAAGTEHYPKIRTFHNKDHSTNDVSQDLREAEKWSYIESGKVDVADLTWEQKEKVLRLLFAKMNGSVVRNKVRAVQAVVSSTNRELHSRKADILHRSCDCSMDTASNHFPFSTQAALTALNYPKPKTKVHVPVLAEFWNFPSISRMEAFAFIGRA
ncbi:PREDICTED: basal body-orientation factor 1, partial [Nanorana parkeri]|uniref:basal body-orientation factor 1 n=1 Tax=Nanorana parkeri TaxID=125878 RepID=UPI0008542FDA